MADELYVVEDTGPVIGMAEDFAGAFFRSGEFAESATIGGLPVSVIFSESSVDLLGAERSNPVLLVEAASVPAVDHGTAVSVRSKAYTVVAHKHDGTGNLLRLELQAA